MKDNSIIFLKDWRILISAMSPENQLEFWDLFMSYDYGVEQECKNLYLLPIWTFVKSQLDNMKNKYQDTLVKRNQINGSKGGRPKKNTETQTEEKNPMGFSETKETQENPKNPVGYFETQKTPNENEKDNEKDNENENVNDNVILLEKETKEENQDFPLSQNLEEDLEADKIPNEGKRKKVAQKKEKFSIPSVQQVQDYCNERKNGISAFSFVNFYQSKDWMIGRNKMKDWKAAVHTWESKNKENGITNNNSNSNTNGSGNSGRANSNAQKGTISFRNYIAKSVNEANQTDSGGEAVTLDAEIVQD